MTFNGSGARRGINGTGQIFCAGPNPGSDYINVVAVATDNFNSKPLELIGTPPIGSMSSMEYAFTRLRQRMPASPSKDQPSSTAYASSRWRI
jgi:hypothetical protein